MLNTALLLIRKFHNLSLSETAIALSVSKSHLSEIEGGKKNPSLELLNKYSTHFEMPLSSILFFAESQESDKPAVNRVRQMINKKTLKLLEWVELIT